MALPESQCLATIRDLSLQYRYPHLYLSRVDELQELNDLSLVCPDGEEVTIVSNKKVRVGIIGIGMFSLGNHVPNLRETGKAEVVAISRRNVERLSRL